MRTLLCLSLVVLLVACATPMPSPTPFYESQMDEGSTPQADYKLQIGDQLTIKFFYNNELNEEVAVRPDGRITMQLLGEISVYGLTPSQLENLLKEQYASRLSHPEVSVIVRSFNMHKVFVDGQVGKPSALPLLGFMTVMQSISQAGGLKDGAKKEILVIRRGEQGKPVVVKVDLNKAMSGKDVSQDIYLAPFDIVYVPRSAVGDVNQFVDLYLRKNIPIGAGIGMGIPFP